MAKPRRSPTIPPLRPLQRQYLSSIINRELTIAIGPAGTGKSWTCALAAAQLLDAGTVDQVVLCRPMVACGGEDMGALPGDLTEKYDPWLGPLLAALGELLGADRLRELRRVGAIVGVPLGLMRGRTWHRSLVILDEAQNTTGEQMEMFLTRLGEGSRAVVNGDLSQSDLIFEDEDSANGLEVALALVDHGQALAARSGVVRFTKRDVVRSGICRDVLEALDRLRSAASDGLIEVQVSEGEGVMVH